MYERKLRIKNYTWATCQFFFPTIGRPVTNEMNCKNFLNGTGFSTWWNLRRCAHRLEKDDLLGVGDGCIFRLGTGKVWNKKSHCAVMGWGGPWSSSCGSPAGRTGAGEVSVQVPWSSSASSWSTVCSTSTLFVAKTKVEILTVELTQGEHSSPIFGINNHRNCPELGSLH